MREFSVSIKRRLAAGFSVFAGLGLLGLGFGRMLESKMIYFPQRVDSSYLSAEASLELQQEIHFERLSIETADGIELESWLLKPLEAEPTAWMVFFHGNASHLGNRGELLASIAEKGWAVLMPDYRGYGRSGGKPSEVGLEADADAAWAALLAAGAPAGKRVIVGHSLGAAVAIGLATRVESDALIVDSGFTSMHDMARAIMPLVPPWALASRYPSLERIQGLDGLPILVLASPADQVIPFEHGRALYAACPGPKAWIELPNTMHSQHLSTRRTLWLDSLESFFDQHLNAQN